MCTVTYFPLRNKTVLTSNRDEKPYRSAQEIHCEKGIFYPKDAAKNGTWFAVTKNGNAIVLLNGAFKNHQRETEYRKSRGTIVLDLIVKENIVNEIQTIDLQSIESFTLVVFQKNELTEFRWDGTQKHVKILDSNHPYIWSSATLYDDEAQEKRKQIFKEFLENETINEEKIWDFHHQKTDDLENGITIKRQNTIQTISTTQLVISDTITLKHLDRLRPNYNPEKFSWKNEPETSLS